jgi:flagella basal body P-ring formation protein FlgA
MLAMIRQRLTSRLPCAVAVIAALAAGSLEAAQQDLDQLKAAAKHFLEQRYTQQHTATTDSEISVADLDPRLRLTNCSAPLTFSVRDIGDNGGAISVKAQCEGEQPWSLYLSAQVDVYREILVAAVPLGRGTLIDSSVITHQRLNTSTLRQGYLTSANQVLGQQLRRSIDAGEPLREGVLEQPLAVERGDIVTLESTSGTIQVATQAEALSSGRVGEQIRVRNTSSERVVRANILGEGRVGANF